MRYLPIGTSDLHGSVIGLGTWGMGGWMWGGVDQEEAVRAIHGAIDHGINLIDTAPIYGFGLSETIVGQAIRDRRDKVILATKCGMVTNTTRGDMKFRSDVTGPSEHGHIGIYIYLHPDSIREEVEASLARCQTDYIDLYQTHWQDSTTAIDQTMAELVKLKDEGKIRAIGVCNASAAQMAEYESVGQLDSDQEKYSMLDREIEQEQLPHCREQHMAVLAYSPLAKGLLTGKIDPQQQFDPADQRSDEERFSKDNRKRVIDMLDQMRPVAEEHDISLAQLVIAWTAHQPGLTHVLCGSRSLDHVRENAEAGDVQLNESELEKMNNAIERFHGVSASA
jgi:aryl-alcohol dehydrogenase-like predicted oxidoreductase